MENKFSNHCRICQSTDIVQISNGKSGLVQCKQCDIVYNSSFPTKEELKDYYSQNYQIDSEKDFVGIEKRRFFRYPEQVSLISEIMSEYKKPPATLLDFGCDKGFFIDEARRFGYKVIGIEAGRAGSEYAQNINLEIHSELDQVHESLDIVTMWHSLEHLLDPIAFMTELKLKMAANSILIIRVPAYDCFWRRIFKDKWVWFQSDNHYFHYSIQSLKNLLLQSGFDVLKVEHRKPNTKLTNRSGSLSDNVFRKYFSRTKGIKKLLARKYQNLTGIEIFAVAIKK